jgi:hypothetical protein
VVRSCGGQSTRQLPKSIDSSTDSSISRKRKRKHRRLTDRSKRRVLPPSIVDGRVDGHAELCVSGISMFASDLLAQLYPDGVSVGMHEGLAGAAIDASSLPGTDAPSESTLQITQLARVLQDGFRRTKIKGPVRDTEWKTKGRKAETPWARSTSWTS